MMALETLCVLTSSYTSTWVRRRGVLQGRRVCSALLITANTETAILRLVIVDIAADLAGCLETACLSWKKEEEEAADA